MNEWTHTSIIHMPYSPFRKDDELERTIVDKLANRIAHFAKNEHRKAGAIETKLNDYSFHHSNRLIAIDISAISRPQDISYLENLGHVIILHPMMLVNSVIPQESLRLAPLDRLLQKKSYILPVFHRMPPMDIALSMEYYGEKFLKLIQGEIDSIAMIDLTWLDKRYRVEDVIARFSGLSLNGDDLIYRTPVTWLGASTRLSLVLDYLFFEASDVDGCSIDDMVDRYSIGRSELESYVENSAFLVLNETGENLKLRFRRRRIVPELMRGELHACEKSMSEHNVIQTSHRSIPNLQSAFQEYHLSGRLFTTPEEPGSSTALMSYIHSQMEGCIKETNFPTNVVVLDGSGEDGMFRQVRQVFHNANVTRIIDFFGSPVLLPFDEIKSGASTIVIADLVNTGEFLRNVLLFIKGKTNQPVAGVFSVIVEKRLERSKFFSAGLIDKDGIFDFYIKKRLLPIDNTGATPLSKQYWGNSKEMFRLFWDTIDRNFSLNKEFSSQPTEVELIGGKKTQIVRVESPSPQVDRSEFYEEPLFCSSLIEIVREYSLEAIVLPNSERGHISAREISGASVNFQSDTDYRSSSRIGFYFTSAKMLIQESGIFSELASSTSIEKILIILLVSKHNVLNETKYLWAEDSENVKNLSAFSHTAQVDILALYESHMPIYVSQRGRDSVSFIKANLDKSS
ncbi:MAG: hypothetical protein ABJ308_11420 [Halieaceae bacterium]